MFVDGFDPHKVPLIREAFGRITSAYSKIESAMDAVVIANGVARKMSSIRPVLGAHSGQVRVGSTTSHRMAA